MLLTRLIKIRTYERGVIYRDREVKGILAPGTHWIFDPLRRVKVDRVSVRAVELTHPELPVLHRLGALDAETIVVDLGDEQRGLVWVDGRFHGVLTPGLNALWKVFHRVEVEVVEVGDGSFEHERLPTILGAPGVSAVIDQVVVETGTAGLLYRYGRLLRRLEPGVHALWRDAGRMRVVHVDLRTETLDVGGQEIMTADKVSLRLNALVTHRVANPERFAEVSGDGRQDLYREAQMALRAVVGGRTLEQLLSDKEAVVSELGEMLRPKAEALGLELVGVGIRDVILPGEMRTLMNRVTEARKAAEANLITRREETAAMRSQANTARILEANPTLMKLRELEVLEKVADRANLSVVLGETGLSDRVLKLI